MSTNSAKNGVAPTPENKNGAGLQTVKPLDKAITTPTPVAKDQPQPITLTSQREKAERLSLLFVREEKLSATKKELERFKLATDESTNTLDLKDGKGATFHTSNPSLIKVVLKDISDELIAKQKQISEDIIAVG